ncbi:MAG: hypothetical protein AABX70_08045 [Nanoarchaeota archaeon]
MKNLDLIVTCEKTMLEAVVIGLFYLGAYWKNIAWAEHFAFIVLLVSYVRNQSGIYNANQLFGKTPKIK